MKKDDLVKIIRVIVKQELKKELPIAMAQIFSNLMNPINSKNNEESPPRVVAEPEPEKKSDSESNEIFMRDQLREIFGGGGPNKHNPSSSPKIVSPKKFTNDPVLNEVLNQTRPFNSSERMAMRAGGSGMGVSPGVMMAAAGFSPSANQVETGAGEMLTESEPSNMKGIPTMPGANSIMLDSLPVGQGDPPQEGSAPMEGMGQLSALDLKSHPDLPDNIKNVLNRDYRSLVKRFNRDRTK